MKTYSLEFTEQQLDCLKSVFNLRLITLKDRLELDPIPYHSLTNNEKHQAMIKNEISDICNLKKMVIDKAI
ncbi:hypothetical protein LCGC14_2643490 [marine sediment metagenome]|uniref:Uncharacterized protein n=1 Tax=marine sediment metagenome TaxID=412755 RepID=A0A0F9C7M2_9ZZZZ